MQAGNKIILDNDYSYIVNKFTGEKTTIEVNNGEFQFDLWVPAPNPATPPMKVNSVGQLSALIIEGDDEDDKCGVGKAGFTRQEILP